MAVANHFIFGTVNSKDYDVTVEGYGNYKAPQRAVEMVSVPGRDGAIIIDKGYYENGEATYKCVIKAKTQYEFEKKIEAFRNAIVSQLGYQRLTEGYLPDEYRMAAYSGGLDEDPEFIGRAGKFKVEFTCVPKRFLLSGEVARTVSNGDVLFNPTLRAAQPLLAVKGYGNISFNGYEIDLENAAMGKVELVSERKTSGTAQKSFANSSYNTGDTITLNASSVSATFESDSLINALTASDSNASFTTTTQRYPHKVYIDTAISAITFTAGTSKTVTNTTTLNLTIAGASSTARIVTTITYTPNVSTGYDRITYKVSATFDKTLLSGTYHGVFGVLWVDSTISLLGDPTYIDCDLGDAYMIKDGEYISLNSYIDLGSDLPVLAPGNNEITIDNTITELKVTPRWWIL